jgi:hypothetical protein
VKRIADDDSYSEIVECLHRHQLTAFDTGRLLEQVETEKLFGPHASFAEFVSYHLQKTERHAFRLIFAYRMRERLIQAKAETLPTNEAQVRPLSRLERFPPTYGKPGLVLSLQVKCWQRACLQKKKGHPPTEQDVTREVNKVMVEKSDFPVDESLRTYRAYIAKVQRNLVRADRMLTDGDLDSFFVLCSAMTPEAENARNRRKRTARELSKISLLIDKHCRNFGTLSYREAGSLFGFKDNEKPSASLTEMSAKEFKLLALALDPAASAGEIENSAVAFIKSLRARGVSARDLKID